MKRYNCPNCGAGITGESCQYCGTVIYDFAALRLGKPSYVKIEHNGTMYIMRMIVTNFSMQHEVETATAWDDFGRVRLSVPTSHCINLSLDAHCVPMDDGALMVMRKQ